MSFKSLTLAALIAVPCALPALADPMIMVQDAYARSAGKLARAGAAFMTLHNHGSEADRLISVTSDAAKRVELHTHKEMGDGVMKMMQVEEGFVIPMHGSHVLARGGDHVMFMGLTSPWGQGDVLTVTFTFEKAGEIEVEIPVDLTRAATASGHGKMEHGDMNHGEMDHTGHDDADSGSGDHVH